MFRFFKSLILMMIIVGGIWALVNRDKLQDPEKLIAELGDWQITLSESASGAWSRFEGQLQQWQVNDESPVDLPTLAQAGRDPLLNTPVLRLGCFGLNHFGADSKDLEQLWLLADTCRRYDLIALQGIDSKDDRWLDMLTDLLGTMDDRADYYYITDREIESGLPTQNCILFNRSTIELDQLKWYAVDDPAGLFLRRPLVGWFRARVNEPDRAFTFTIANVELPEDSPQQNRFRLKSLMRAVRDDGRLEDDIILLGKTGLIQVAEEIPNQSSFGIQAVMSGPNDLLRRETVDNIVFNTLATAEFTGRGGAFDFYRYYNLTLPEAQALSSRLPLWAEFSVFEGGEPSRSIRPE